MKHYDSIPRIQDDGTLKGEVVWGFNKLDGQNFCATFKPKANIDFNEGITLIPNQMCKSLDGNYLYIENNVKGDKQTNSNENNEQKRLEISLYMKLLLLFQMLSLILN